MYTLLLMASLNGAPDAAAFGGHADCSTCSVGYSPLGFKLRYPFGGFFTNLFAKCRAKHAVWLPSDCGCSAPVGCGGCSGCSGCFGCGGCGGVIVDGGLGCGGCSGCSGCSGCGGCGGMVAALPPMHGHGHHGPLPAPAPGAVPMDVQGHGIPGLPPGAIITSPAPAVGAPMPAPGAPIITPAPNAPMVPSTIPPVSYYRPQPVPTPAPVPASVTRAAALGATEGEPLSAKLTFEVPAGATLYVDGVAVPGSGPVRKFHTPPLPRGKTFYYEFRAEVKAGDKVEKQEKVIPICAGDLVSEKLVELAAK